MFSYIPAECKVIDETKTTFGVHRVLFGNSINLAVHTNSSYHILDTEWRRGSERLYPQDQTILEFPAAYMANNSVYSIRVEGIIDKEICTSSRKFTLVVYDIWGKNIAYLYTI